jgi:hypothetical protein
MDVRDALAHCDYGETSRRAPLPQSERKDAQNANREVTPPPTASHVPHPSFFPVAREVLSCGRRPLAVERPCTSKERLMKLVESIDRGMLEKGRLIAESSEFAIFDVGSDTYALVHRHEGVDWQGITISGDGLFRVAELLARDTRALYRNVAAELSKERNR